MDKRKILIQLDSDLTPASSIGSSRSMPARKNCSATAASSRIRYKASSTVRSSRAARRTEEDRSFIGGSDVAAGETLLAEALKHMIPKFGLRVLDHARRQRGQHDGRRCGPRGGPASRSQGSQRLSSWAAPGPSGNASLACWPAKAPRFVSARASKRGPRRSARRFRRVPGARIEPVGTATTRN